MILRHTNAVPAGIYHRRESVSVTSISNEVSVEERPCSVLLLMIPNRIRKASTAAHAWSAISQTPGDILNYYVVIKHCSSCTTAKLPLSQYEYSCVVW